MLASGRGFVEPHPVFADVTGDGKADALVRVLTGGAAGAVAVYVLSTDGTTSSNLRVVMRNQRLYRATVKVNDAHNLVVRVPVYAAGDTLCCPSRARDRTYAWNRGDQADAARLDRRVPAHLSGATRARGEAFGCAIVLVPGWK